MICSVGSRFAEILGARGNLQVSETDKHTFGGRSGTISRRDARHEVSLVLEAEIGMSLYFKGTEVSELPVFARRREKHCTHFLASCWPPASCLLILPVSFIHVNRVHYTQAHIWRMVSDRAVIHSVPGGCAPQNTVELSRFAQLHVLH